MKKGWRLGSPGRMLMRGPEFKLKYREKTNKQKGVGIGVRGIGIT
jgi:hypothetical protein